jgi:hypothetical protein
VGRKRRAKPLHSICEAYPEPVVTLLPRSPVRRIPPTTIVVLMLSLLVTQAASFVCGAQCLQHQQPSRTAMTHCQAMHPSSKSITTQTCPLSATSRCVIDLLANNRQKNLAPPTIHADARPATLLPVSTVAARTPVFPLLRSTIGDPPLITPLRV